MTDTTNTFIAVNGHRLRALKLQVSTVGPWVAEVDLTEPAAISGKVTLAVGETELVGTVVTQQSGEFALQTTARIVGGAGGWGKLLSARGYHNDAGVKARLIAEDAARECGESIQSFAPGADRVGLDYARANEAASTVLEYAAGGAPWWVDYNGLTYVGARPSSSLDASSYVLQSYNARERVGQLAIDDLASLHIGSIVSDERLDGPQVVRDFEVSTRDNSPLRASVWFGGLPSEPGRLAGLMRAIIRRTTAGELPGCYRYRVVTMNGDGRVDLQAVRKQAGVPDLRSCAQWPGVPGTTPTLALGSEVIVQFIDSDPSQPMITAYAGPGGAGFVPTQLVLGGATGEPAARQGDAVEVLLPPAQFVGTVNNLPATGVVSWLVPKADGTITGGSGKVRIAT
jgi:hypothetical protein